jgi:hypothetical protein
VRGTDPCRIFCITSSTPNLARSQSGLRSDNTPNCFWTRSQPLILSRIDIASLFCSSNSEQEQQNLNMCGSCIDWISGYQGLPSRLPRDCVRYRSYNLYLINSHLPQGSDTIDSADYTAPGCRFVPISQSRKARKVRQTDRQTDAHSYVSIWYHVFPAYSKTHPLLGGSPIER